MTHAQMVIFFLLICFWCVSCDQDEKADDPKNAKTDTKSDTDTDTENSKDDTEQPDTNDTAEEDEDDVQEDELEDEDEEGKMDTKAALEELRSLSGELEAKRHELNLKERELIQREQMMTRLELEILKKSEMLRKLKKDAADAILAIEDKYKKEHDKLEVHRQKIKDEQQAFLKKHSALREQVLGDQEKRADDLKDAMEEMAQERDIRIAHLMKTIKGMRPDAGAGMLASMDKEDAIHVLRGLDARKTAALLGAMPAKKAAELAEGMLGPKVPKLDDLPPVDPSLLGEMPKEE